MPQTPPPRSRTVRSRIVTLLMVPVVSLLGLWAFATVSTVQDIARMRQAQVWDTELRTPVTAAVHAVQRERRAAARYLADPTPRRADTLTQAGNATARATKRLTLGHGPPPKTVADTRDFPNRVADRTGTLVERLNGLRTLREGVLAKDADWPKAYAAYTATVDSAFRTSGALAARGDGDGRTLAEFSRGAELLSRQDALLAAAQLSGSLPRAQLREFSAAADARRQVMAAAGPDLAPAAAGQWQRLTGSDPYRELAALEDAVLAAGPGETAAQAAPGARWDRARADVQRELRQIEKRAASAAAARTDPLAQAVFSTSGLAVALGLLAVVAALVISVRVGRGLVIELVALRNGALELARRKLPRAMRRLRQGKEIDIEAEAPRGAPASDEMGQVSEALGTVHRAALRAAAERAELASGISGVFVNLARRSQVLVHRQLALLDGMERRTEDPAALDDLFRLDHLTTRMRRHAESLIILSGAAPGRAWRKPVPLTQVVRSAVSEVEEYARIEVRGMPDTAVIGAAVADLTHLLAELIENAAHFSPPHTTVRVTGEEVGNGYAIEVEDRGLGMSKEALERANQRIEQSEALDLFDSDRLGLFVVSRLAARHTIRVSLRPSPYGGTTAVVLLPTTVLQQPAPTALAARALAARAPVAAAPTAQRAAAVKGGPVPSEAAQGTPDGLPRRVRQASLAPQLREAPPPMEPRHAPASGDHGLSPELARDRMEAFRSGWLRGSEPVVPDTTNEGEPS